ncbi:MAG TPA: 2-oxoglutarate dehydrogenase complex dihydrolipoyllysine-residue succinyltransferase, partial [Burkholderiales bacterium]
LELPAPLGGVITQILKGDGGTVVSGEVIAVIDTAADSAAAVAKAAERPAAPVAQAAKQVSDQSNLMPAARKLVEEKKLDARSIAGSGRDGRVTKADVIAHLEGGAAARPSAAAPAAASAGPRLALPEVPAPINVDKLRADRPEQRVPMSRLRARVAERLLQSQATAAILTTFNEINMQPVMDLRRKHRDQFEKEHGVKLGFMSFFVKAAVYALKKYPIVNASVDGNEIVYHGYFDIGVAVGSPRGLVVPVLRDADQMSFAQIEKAIADLGKRAGEGKLAMEELTGGTFSISNGGVFGSMLSTPIINPPQSAILGIHATKERAVVEGGQIVIRPMNYLALSYDHRIIDGREAVLSLVAMKDALEDPVRLLLDL